MKKLSLVLFLAATTVRAGEGMWMPQQVPQLAAELRKAGMKIDPARFADLTGDPMGAVISLGGCTASFVSPDGLAVTNHHCAEGSIQFNSSPEHDYLNDGFLARTREQELRAAPAQRIWVTTNIEDVTGRITGNISAKLSDVEREKEIDRREKALVDEIEKQPGLSARVASFFEGSQYLRITQMEIRDVRLVYAPASGVGVFGGETDNWMWPRHTGDFSFLRAYVGPDGKPAGYSPQNVPFHPAHWLKIATGDLDEGDFVIVAGYPGRTFRYSTEAEVRNARDFRYPSVIRYATELNRILNETGKGNREVQIKNASRIRSNDNTLKNYTGTLETLRAGAIVEQRHKREAELAAFIATHPKYAGLLEKMRALNEEQYATRERDTVLLWLTRSSPMLSQAQRVWRNALEKSKADLERQSEYRERNAEELMQMSTRAQKQIDRASDRAALRFFLTEATKLPAGQRIAPLDQLMGSQSVDAFLDKLYAGTQIDNSETRRAMYGQTTAQLKARGDAMLDLAAALAQLSLANEERDNRIGGAMSRVRPLYMEALRELTGGRLYPDANSTLRVTFGEVAGYTPRDGVRYTPQTTLSGVVKKDTGSGEFNSPKGLLAAARAKKTAGYIDPELGDVPVNFLSTVDTTGGNSGSPTLNANGELVGLLFDGNYEALGSDFLFEPELTRSIHVDIRYTLWVMDAVDGAQNLLREMGVQPKY
ncbi:MAG TPA: S46 family peptidase [Thermoanaerobaculia bacterium]|nr:S46 family peptidase [Thermoanaerobaculia bacterium]